MVQTCVVHLLRHSLDFVSYKGRKPVAAALKIIYRAVDAEADEAELRAFEEGLWARRYPAIARSWRRAWTEVVPLYALHFDVRRILYTTNAIEALNAKLRRAVRARGPEMSGLRSKTATPPASRCMWLVNWCWRRPGRG